MTTFGRLLNITLLTVAAIAPLAGQSEGRIVQPIDEGWLFRLADTPDEQQPPAPDAPDWREVSVPHDWSIEGPYSPDAPTGRGGGYLPAGVGWYVKTIEIPASWRGRTVFIEFDGVMAHSDVWLNGEHLSHRPYGYSSFRCDLTPHLNWEGENTIVVRADNSRQPASRWYTGAGIYRHVRIVVTDPVHIDQWGVFVTTPEVRDDRATVRVQTDIVNTTGADREVALTTAIESPDGREVAAGQHVEVVPAGITRRIIQVFEIPDPQRWDLDTPRLYTAVSRVTSDGRIHDNQRTRFGIREFEFRADTGFWINGRNIKIKGVALHHDGGAVGAAVPLDVWRRRFELLREMGANAIRTAHNPFSQEFFDLADEMGFLVMHEVLDAWTVGKNSAEQGYHRDFAEWWSRDTEDAVRRDRNHPSIFIYSAGNEIRDNLDSLEGVMQLQSLLDLYHTLDPSRPVTMALFRPNQMNVYDNGFADMLDVIGQNYREGELIAAWRQNPQRRVIGTENTHGREVWLQMRDNPFYSGQFLWTGIDYLGEADWPAVAWSTAPIDRSLFRRPMFYERASWWSETPMVHIARMQPNPGGRGGQLVSDWTPHESAPIATAEVRIFSNCEEVELILNGESLGTREKPADDAPRTWNVPYAPGTIVAIGRNDGREVARHELRTAGPAVRLNVTASRAQLAPGFDNVAFVEVLAVDEHGTPQPWAEGTVTFSIEGPGRLVAVDNGDVTSHESYTSNQRSLYRGRVIALVRATRPTGEITIRATTDGLEAGSVTITATGD